LSDTTTTSGPWLCPCGGRYHGNGGRSSHQRTCAAYHQDKIDRLGRNIAFWSENDPALHSYEIHLARADIEQHQTMLDEILARAEGKLTASQRTAAAGVPVAKEG
jgi:hypothetical protein